MKSIFSILLFLAIGSCAEAFSQAKNCQIEFSSPLFKNNKYYLAGNYGKYQTLLDSVNASKNGAVVFKKEGQYIPGIYMLVDAEKKIVYEFLMDEQQQFRIQPNFENPTLTKIENSNLNIDFNQFNVFLKNKMDLIAKLKGQLSEQKNSQDSLTIQNKITEIQKDIAANKKEYVAKNPSNMMALLFRLTRPIDDFTELAENQVLSTKLDTIAYLKNNYFKDIDLSDPRILRTPFIDNRMDVYFNSFVIQNPEEIVKEVVSILEKTGDKNGELFKYLSLHFVNKYVDPKIMGLDRVFIAIYEKYFNDKKYDWLKLEQIEFLKYNFKILKNNQVGDKAPNLFMMSIDEKRIDLYDIQAPYTVLIFWDPTCGHCVKEIPKISNCYQETWKQKGIKVFAVNNNSTENNKWKEFINKENLKEWINVYPPSSITGNYTQEQVDFQTLYNIKQTPVVFLLDSDKKIIAKKIGFDNYIKIIEEIETKKQ